MEQLQFDFDGDKTFLTEDEIVKDILGRMTQEDRDFLKNTKEEDLIMFHHGYGTWIRNNYLLWDPKNPHTNKEDARHDLFPDQFSQRVIERVWMTVSGKRRTFRMDVVDQEDGSFQVNKVMIDEQGRDIVGKDDGGILGKVFK